MVCGGFACSRHSLIILNVIYIVVSFIIIGVAAYGRVAAVITSLTLVGSLIACGVFLFLIALVGLVGAAKHHQVLLFFYMIILFLLFLLQFALACACLAVNADQKDSLARQGWQMSSAMTKADVQHQFDCCGFDDQNLNVSFPMGHPPCGSLVSNKLTKCCEGKESSPCCSGQYTNNTAESCPCQKCYERLRPIIYNAFSATGGVGLFFSFTEILGVWLTIRYRNQKDPSANPSAYL
ncbi:tetraspanin-13-like isoform X2 [Biomphalaria glabrata]|uniref:Tetraspanin-13-like isoform X2 n=1 Tax=Biomphalaria glabrata TaxID=6526 RepID=A0A9W2YBB1_BIOGL|nr:tetraspanin-13-like isoform X2 [Biomphalaria glabrata]XP_055859990.1 tetraspanin-13-like isoform X2 [Biomphalaria glabrata]